MEAHKITSVVVVDDGARGRGRRAPPRPVAHGDVLTYRRTVRQAASIKLALFDVDGVLTDGTHPGARRRHRVASSSTSATAPAIVWAQRAGLRRRPAVGALGRRDRDARRAARHHDRACRASRTSSPATSRSSPTGADRRARSPTWATTCMDLPVLRRVGFSAAPADAAADVRAAVHWVSASRRRPRRGARVHRARAARAGQRGAPRSPTTSSPDGDLLGRCSSGSSRCSPASPSARRGSATSCGTAGGSIAAARASRRTTCSGSTSWSPTRSTSRSRS